MEFKSRCVPESWSRISIISIEPNVDAGRWPIKRTVGEAVTVVAGIIVDGHDKLAAEVLHGREGETPEATPLTFRHNDEFEGAFVVREPGRYAYRIRAWVDAFGTWHEQFGRRVQGGEREAELRIELMVGAALLRKAAMAASKPKSKQLLACAATFEAGEIKKALETHVVQLARDCDPRVDAVESVVMHVDVDPVLARCAAWYEFFPRSSADAPGRHGTLDDAARRLEHIKEMGFNIVYLPPVHPIGRKHRKGKDNNPRAKSGEPGSPWAIGSAGGGHKSVHRRLGGLAAFDRFVAKARDLDLHVAIDIAFQCSPDHPYVREHPEWFSHRPDGSIRYAENPPKKYQDVYPFDLACADHESLWQELKSIFEFWIRRGVRIFRVDNPHTKPLAFWEWCLAGLRTEHPDLIFLAEAFTRPKTMYQLAKLGFNNSYTYFTWRNSKEELRTYLTELTQSNVVEFFRPNFWPNTPDILHEYLVHGGRPAHVVRYVLASTLSPVYGVYGPPYEHVRNKQHPAREEYADNEKYEIRTWDWNDPTSLQPLFRRVNRIRRENPALQTLRSLRFLQIDNPNILAYTKQHGANIILCLVNLDPFQAQEGFLELPLKRLGLPAMEPFQVYDLLGGDRIIWQGSHQQVRLDPHVSPARILRVLRRFRTEEQFDYYA